MNPKYSIYIISKGRWENQLTLKALEKINVPYHIVIEPQEYDDYAKVVDSSKIYVLPFSNLGQGSIPVRNWVWEYSLSIGEKKHWILDDNISDFYRTNRNARIHILDGTIFRCAEDFVDRYKNIAFSGFNYMGFVKHRQKVPPFYLNTRIYSCILINNEVPYRWRGRFNEDTDLCLRALKDGWCTVLFNAFLADKVATMRMKGGNTDEIYKDTDNRYEFAESLKNQHPDVVKITKKYGRWHHQVNYKPFARNKLILKEGINIPKGVNNYGMKLVEIDKEQEVK